MRLISGLSIRSKLLISILPLIGVILGGIILLVMSSFEKVLLHEQEKSLQQVVKKTQIELDFWILDRERDLQLLAWNPTILSRSEQTAKFLERYKQESSFLENAFVADTEGVQTFDAIGGKSVGLDLKTLPFAIGTVAASKAKSVFISDAFKAPHSGFPVVLMTAPIIENDQTTGIVGTPVELAVFSKAFMKNADMGEQVNLAVLDFYIP